MRRCPSNLYFSCCLFFNFCCGVDLSSLPGTTSLYWHHNYDFIVSYGADLVWGCLMQLQHKHEEVLEGSSWGCPWIIYIIQGLALPVVANVARHLASSMVAGAWIETPWMRWTSLCLRVYEGRYPWMCGSNPLVSMQGFSCSIYMLAKNDLRVVA